MFNWFVTRSNYDRLVAKFNYLAVEERNLRYKYQTLVGEWNALVKQINNHGGWDIFTLAKRGTTIHDQFSKEDLNRLIMLCHPDKHGGKPMAEEMTRKLIAARDQREI